MLIVVLFSLSTLLLSHEMGWIGPQPAHAFTLEQNEANFDAAYKAVIHRVWLDKPSYVEDVLWETDEMLHLDALLEGKWDDTFTFWSERDSIDYNTNWLYDPIMPDTIVSKPKPDKPMKPLPQIHILNTVQ